MQKYLIPLSSDTLSRGIALGGTAKCHDYFSFLVIVGTCCVVGVVGLLAAAVFWYK